MDRYINNNKIVVEKLKKRKNKEILTLCLPITTAWLNNTSQSNVCLKRDITRYTLQEDASFCVMEIKKVC